MNDIVISEFMDQAAVDVTSARYDVLYEPTLVDNSAELTTAISGARALVVRNRTQVNAGLLESAPRLKVVGRLGVGLDNIDVVACKARGVTVCPAIGANDDAVAEWVIGTTMLLLRGAYGSLDAMLRGAWPRNQLIGHEIGGKSMGLVGYGGIARRTATLASALGMDIVAYDPHLPADDPSWRGVKRVQELPDLLEDCDVVSLHVPLTEDTRHLIGAEALAAMKQHAVLVNAARGGVVDEAALADTLRAGKLGGAALDVFEEEPLTQKGAEKFAGLTNLILTPHIAGVTDESNTRVSHMTMENVRRVLEQEA